MPFTFLPQGLKECLGLGQSSRGATKIQITNNDNELRLNLVQVQHPSPLLYVLRNSDMISKQSSRLSLPT